jgi:hypothetical protein
MQRGRRREHKIIIEDREKTNKTTQNIHREQGKGYRRKHEIYF